MLFHKIKQLILFVILVSSYFPVALRADLISADLVKQSLVEFKKQQDERLLISIQNTILSDIGQAKKVIETIRLKDNPLDVMANEKSWKVFYGNLANISSLLNDLVHNVNEQKLADYDTKKIATLVQRLLLSESEYISTDVQEIEDAISSLSQGVNILGADKLFKYQMASKKHLKKLEGLLKAIEDNKKLMTLLTLVKNGEKISARTLLDEFASQQSKQFHPLVKREIQVLEEIRKIRLQLGKERDAHRLSTGEERLIAWIILRQNLFNLFELLDDLVENYLEQKAKGLDAHKLKDFLTKFLTSESKYIRYDIDASLDDLRILREKIKHPKTEDLYKFQVAIGKQQINLEKTINSLINNIQRLSDIGLDPSDDTSYLNQLLNRLANKLAIRVHIVIEEQEMLAQRLSGLEDVHGEIKDRLELEYEIIKVKKERIISSLNKVISLMKKQHIDTSTYTTLLIQETGYLSQGFFDLKVIKGISGYWFKFFLEWLQENGSWLLFKVLLVAFILTISKILSQIVGYIINEAIHGSKLSLTYLLKEFIVSASKRIVIFIGILLSISQLGLEIAPLLTGLGIAGFVIGFALQDTLSNFASGIMILVYRPYDVNDLVEVAGFFGKVKRMNLVSTTILTPSNRRLILPNNKIWGDVINNATAEHTRRIDLVFSISYSDNIAFVEKVLYQVLDEHPLVLNKPEPLVKVDKLGDSSVDFIVRPWVKTDNYLDVHWDITRMVKERFDAENISIPFPQRDIHFP